MSKARLFHFSPGRVLLASFAFVIIVGTVLLSLPQAQEVKMSILDVLFTATSTTCVTGLHVVPISHFTFFGKCVMLALMQIGGLGLMTLSFFFVSLFLNLGMASRMIAGQLLDFASWGKIRSFLLIIIGLTIFIEVIGALLLYIPFSKTLNSSDAIFYAIFHSVSAFCNAGTSLFEHGFFPYANSPFALITTSFLVIAGGIGFIVWYDLCLLVKRFVLHLRGIPTLFTVSLHTKLVMITTAGLLAGGTVLIWFIERFNTLKDFSFFHSIVGAFFIGTSARSAGMELVDFSHASHATLFILLIFMLIGSSPSSTGGGIKTTSFALFLATVVSIIRNRESVELFGRTIPTDQIYKVMAIIAIATSWIALTTFLLLLIEKDFTFMQILFESVSAFATCGYTTGITTQLSQLSKIVLVVSMIAGRIGSLTIILALRKRKERLLYHYPEERFVIG